MYFLLCAFLLLTAANGLYNSEVIHIKDFPYQAAIGPLSATIISKNWIITADYEPGAQLDKDPAGYMVQAGRRSTSSSDPMKGSLHNVEKIIKYKDEKNSTGPKPYNSIALMRVKEPFQFDNTRQPIELFKENEKLVPGTIANVTGFGLHIYAGRVELQLLQVPIMDPDLCNSTYQRYVFDNQTVVHEAISEGNICADYRNNTGRRSDFNAVYLWGSSLTVNNRLAGISSRLEGIGLLPQNPKLFIDIAYYRKWIEQNVDQPLL